MLLFSLAAATAAMPASPVPDTLSQDIVVVGALVPVEAATSAASATVLDRGRIDALGAPLVVDLLRLVPGVSVSVSGAQGAQAQVRIRGAEANHSLLFVDGIQLNDPAAGNEGRFEILGGDGLDRVEVVRGPQSALFGSEALGGVVALASPDPVAGTSVTATGELGTHDFARGATSIAVGGERGGVSATGAWLRSDGIDILGGRGDRDGFENRTGSIKGVLRADGEGELGLVARYIDHDAMFDGTDPVTFTRADTADATRTRTGALRAWATVGRDADAPLSATVEGQYLRSTNRNRNGEDFLNRSVGDRLRVGGQLVARAGAHTLIGRVDREDESFDTNDAVYFGGTNQHRTRGRTAFVGELRSSFGPITTDLAVRHDAFNRFSDETTVRAGAVAALGAGISLVGSCGEGIAQPTFFDLYGFFPGSFTGNPDLVTERSRGFEAGLRYAAPRLALAVTGFDNRLRDEIVGTFANGVSSTANASGRSRRRGIEAAADWRPLDGLRLSANYTLLKAQDQQVAGADRVREVRRPRHSGNLAADYRTGPLTVGGSLAYVGRRRDTDFDLFPAADVRLDDYVLAGARLAFALTPAIEAFGRVDNAFDATYQDVVGYATPGRTVYAGLRFRLDR